MFFSSLFDLPLEQQTSDSAPLVRAPAMAKVKATRLMLEEEGRGASLASRPLLIQALV